MAAEPSPSKAAVAERASSMKVNETEMEGRGRRSMIEKLVTLFTSSGFTSLREFSELDETDLDQLHVVQSEDRAKLLTAAQLLHDYENEGYESCSSRSASQSPATSQDAACQTSSSHGQSGDDDSMTSSSSHHHHHHHLASTPVSTCLSLSSSRTAVNGCGSAGLAAQWNVASAGSRRLVKCGYGMTTSQRYRHVTGACTSAGQHHRSLSTLTKQHRQLVQSMMRMLEIDGVDLSRHPFTNHVTGESGVPASLIRHYSDALGCGRSEAVLAMEDCRQSALIFNKRRPQPTTSSVARAIPDTDTSTSVSDWLASLGLSSYSDTFIAHKLTHVDQLLTLSGGNLEALGVTNRQHVDILVGAIDAIIADTQAHHAPAADTAALSVHPRSNRLHPHSPPADVVDRV